jgi:hypothetical protein
VVSPQLVCPRAQSKRRPRVRQSDVHLDWHQPPACANPAGSTPICWRAGVDDHADCILHRTDTSHVLNCRAHGSEQPKNCLRWLGSNVAGVSAHRRRPWPRRGWRPRRLGPMPASCAKFEEKAHRTSWPSNGPRPWNPNPPPRAKAATRGCSRKFPHNGDPRYLPSAWVKKRGAVSRPPPRPGRIVVLTRLRMIPALTDAHRSSQHGRVTAIPPIADTNIYQTKTVAQCQLLS